MDIKEEYYKDIYNMKPSWWMKWSITIVFIIITILLTLSYVISYPDVVQSEFRLTTNEPSIVLPIKNKRQIQRIFIANNDKVKANTHLLLFENDSEYEDVILLEKELQSFSFEKDSILSFTDRFLNKDLRLGSIIEGNWIDFSTELLEYYIKNGTANYGKNEIHTILSRKVGIQKALNKLMTSIKKWKQNNVLISPIAGEVIFLQDLKQDVYYNGDVIFISPLEKEYYASVKIPFAGAGKVKELQRTILKLSDYPYREYGFIEGRLSKLSVVAGENFYLGKVEFNKDNISSYGKQIILRENMSGIGEIITNDRSILERVFERIIYVFKTT